MARWVIVLALILALPAPGGAGEKLAGLAGPESGTPVLLALEPVSNAAAGSRGSLDVHLLALAEALAAGPDGLRVVERFVADSSVAQLAEGRDSEAEILKRASGAGAELAVVGTVTELAGEYSLELRALPVAGGPARATATARGAGPEGLGEAVRAAAAQLRGALRASAQPQAPVEAPEQGAEPVDVLAKPVAPGEKVAAIHVQGNRRVDADAVRAVLGTRVGEALRAEGISEDVRRIFALGFFRDVQVSADATPEGQAVTYTVEENPVIRRVSVTGNEALDGEDIKEKLTLTVGSTVDYPLLIENRQRIQALYQTEGYHRAEVSYALEELGEGAVGVDFAIVEGQKLRLVEIDFVGNQALADGELLDVVETKPWKLTSNVTRLWDHSGLYAEPLFFQDLDRVQRRYMDEGYIRVSLSEPELVYEEDELRVRVVIDEGPRFKVGAVNVAGDDSMDHGELVELVELEPGLIFDRGMLSEDVERLRSRYADRGFFSARVHPVTKVDAEHLTVDCTFQVAKGDLYFVDRIDVHGNTRTRDEVVRREMDLAEGELYSASALERSSARVKRLGFFEEVSLETRHLADPQRVAIDIDVVERQTGSVSFGAGYGSSDGFLVNSSLQQENLFGKGYALSADVDLGTVNRRAYLGFTEPYLLGTSTSLTSSLQMSRLEYLDFRQELKGVDLDLYYPLDSGETRIGTGWGWSTREVQGFDEFQASSLLQREEFQGSVATSLLGLNLRRDTRDDIRFPKRGQVSGVALEFAGLGGLTNFARLEGRTTWWFPVGRWLPFDPTFLVNSRIGWAIPLNSISDFDLPECTGRRFLEDGLQKSCKAGVLLDPTGKSAALADIDTDLKLPLTERYFLGGIGAFQVRGFKQRSLGPRRTLLSQQPLPNGERYFFPALLKNDVTDKEIEDFEDLDLTDVIGGNKMFLLNLEMQFPISEEMGLQGLVFLDMGNAFAENESINPANFRFGTGMGVQWFSPFGPILVQLGFPLDRLEDEDASVFEFSLGGAQY